MSKKVAFGTQPNPKAALPVTPDQWVEQRSLSPSGAQGGTQAETQPGAQPGAGEPMKRLTIDLPESLHRRVKMMCAQRGVKMVDAIRALLEAEFPDSPAQE